MIVDHRVAELVDQPAHVDRDVEFLGAHRVGGRDLLPDFLLFLFVRLQFHPIDEKKTAKKASSRMTRKTAAAREEVVRRPTSSPSWRPCTPGTKTRTTPRKHK